MEAIASLSVGGWFLGLVLQAAQVDGRFNSGEFIGAGIVVVLLLLVMKNQREDTKQFLERFGKVEASLAAIPGLVDAAVTKARHDMRGELNTKLLEHSERQADINGRTDRRLERLEHP